MIMYERRHETAPPSVAQSPSFPLSTPPPASPKQETKNKASALGKERLSASPPSSRPASPRQKTEDAIEKRRLAVEGARSAYESVRANPNTIGKMLRLYETTLKKAEKAYEEAKKGELMEPE